MHHSRVQVRLILAPRRLQLILNRDIRSQPLRIANLSSIPRRTPDTRAVIETSQIARAAESRVDRINSPAGASPFANAHEAAVAFAVTRFRLLVLHGIKDASASACVTFRGLGPPCTLIRKAQ